MYEFVAPCEQVNSNLASKYRSWNTANMPWVVSDFSWKRSPKKDAKSLLSDLKSSLSKCSEIVIATDVDPTGEGQLIAWEIIDGLGLHKKQISRMFFIDESSSSVQKAFCERKPLPVMSKDPEFLKADYRSKFDFLTMQFTRAAVACGDGTSVLRQGRLKSAMVSLVGGRLNEIKNYKKEFYYEHRFIDDNDNVFTTTNADRFPSKDQVPLLQSSKVVVDSTTMKTMAPPLFLDLAALSSILAVQGVPAKTILATYQKMYEAQVVSYPRTEDKTITEEQFKELLPYVDQIANLVGVDVTQLTHRIPRSTHVKNQGAHGANRPGLSIPRSLSSLSSYGPFAEEIYTIVCESFLMMFCEDYEYEHQKAHLLDYPTYTSIINTAKKLGYRALSSRLVDDDADQSSSNGFSDMANPFIYEGVTPKPKNPTMKWLMSRLEKRDVGTGATRLSIYTDVIDEKKKYPLLLEKKGKLLMTDYGVMSYLLLQDTHIGDLNMTEQLFQNMRAVADGTATVDACLNQVSSFVADDIKTMTQNGVKMRKELNMSDDIQVKEKYEGDFNGETVSFNRSWSTYKFSDDECEQLLRGETLKLSGLISKTGNPYSVSGKLELQTYKGKSFYGFKANFDTTGPPAVWCGYRFSENERTVLEAGGTIDIKGCVSKAGKKFNPSIRYGEDDNGNMKILFV